MFYILVFIFSVVFTFVHGDIVDKIQEENKKNLKKLLDIKE